MRESGLRHFDLAMLAVEYQMPPFKPTSNVENV